MTDDPKIHVDEDWKRRAQLEKEQLAAQERGARKAQAGPAAGAGAEDYEAPGGASLSSLVGILASQALVCLGAAPDPITGGARRDLEQARAMIDLLDVLERKTRGNRTPEEDQAIQNTLHDLRLMFVEATTPRKRPPPGSPPPAGARPR